MGRILVADIAGTVNDHEVRISKLENDNVLQTEQIATIKRCEDDHEKEYKDLEGRMDRLEDVLLKAGFTLSLVNWIGGAVGLAIISLVISIITGQVELNFK